MYRSIRFDDFNRQTIKTIEAFMERWILIDPELGMNWNTTA